MANSSTRKQPYRKAHHKFSFRGTQKAVAFCVPFQSGALWQSRILNWQLKQVEIAISDLQEAFDGRSTLGTRMGNLADYANTQALGRATVVRVVCHSGP